MQRRRGVADERAGVAGRTYAGGRSTAPRRWARRAAAPRTTALSGGGRARHAVGMPSLYDLKPAFQRLLEPLVARVVARGSGPDPLTWFALLVSAGAGAATLAGGGWLWWVPVLLLGRMACNAAAGMVARRTGRTTRHGAVLNETGDVVSDWLCYMPWVAHAGAWSVLAFVAVATLTEVVALAAAAAGGVRSYAGPLGKADRAAAIAALAVVGAVATVPWWAFAALVALGALTVVRRWREGLA